MRINKYMSMSGIASRRECDKLIEENKVKINGIAAKLGQDVNPETDVITVNGKEINIDTYNKVYYILNKPKGYICTKKDDKNRPTIFDIIKNQEDRLFSIGRLDYNSEGLIIITNDGDLTYKITHPKFEITKTYVVKIRGKFTDHDREIVNKGVRFEGETYKVKNVVVTNTDEKTSRLEIVLSEGKNREIRKIFEALHKEVLMLKRTKIGSLTLGGLNRGEYRELKPVEIKQLKSMFE